VGNVGSAVVDFAALGDPVNVAARLQAEAGGGQIVVAEDVHDDLAGMVPAADRRTVAVGGRDGGVPVLIAGV
jgi:adenylate cyclase